ncbi:MAG: hypothetical protein N2035_06060 [Chthoniobacterales bacterium]|nr:hypothetical protein [Chthoniobacterales bacterium]
MIRDGLAPIVATGLSLLSMAYVENLATACLLGRYFPSRRGKKLTGLPTSFTNPLQ